MTNFPNLTADEIRAVTAPVCSRNVALAQALARILTKDETGWHDDAARKPKGQTNERASTR